MKPILATILVLLLSACSPTVVRTLHDADYTATFYDTPCKDVKVRTIAAKIGVPTAIVEAMKAGEVTFTDSTPKRNFCYKDYESGLVTFILDDSGSMGNLSLSPK